MINQSAGNFLLRALVVVSAILAAGCDLSTGEVNSGINQFVTVRNPVGHVQGIVLDSNGAPVKGAKVAIGSRTETTGVSGTYEFRNLEVTNVTTDNTSNDNDTDHSSFRIVITPPAVTNSQPTTYLGTIVEVYPEAQFNSTNAQFNDSEQALEQAGAQAVFIDGFRIQAEDAVLPALTQTVRVIALRDNDTGQAIASTQVALDFQDVSSTCCGDEPSDGGQQFHYPSVTWTGTTDANGSVTFTNVPANSQLTLSIAGYDCDDEDNGDSNQFNSDCEVFTENEVTPVTINNFWATAIVDDGDTVNPYLVNVAGVYDDTTTATGFPEGTECSGTENIGKLLRNVDGTSANGGFVLQANEALQTGGVSASSAVVYDATNQTYVNVSGVAVSGSTITVTTASALTNGAEFSIYLFRPDFLDRAGNAITEASDSLINFDCLGNITPALGSGTSFLAVDLEAFAAPVTNPGSVAAVQEDVDPRLALDRNDAPSNQAQSVSFNDIRDEDDGNDNIWGMNATEAPNSTGDIEFALQRRYDAYGDVSGVNENGSVTQDNARLEFAPATGAPGYRIDINGFDATNVTDATFAGDEFVDTFVGTIDGNDVRVGFVDRGGTMFYVVIVENAEEGDVVNIAALDDLGHAGVVSSVTIVDNVQPTVTVQRSYNHLIAYDDFNNQDVDADSAGDNASGCFSHDDNHAGIFLTEGTDFFGEGGELSDPGSDVASGNLCVGSSPELLVDSGGNPNTLHTELVQNRDADLTTALDGTDSDAHAYDGGAFTAWARPVIKMGVAVTENLGSTGTPTETVSATLSNFAVQNDTVDSHLGAGPEILDLITFDVNDAYVLANADHGQTITFTGMTDLAGNAATAGANAVVNVRDQWPPYIATASRGTNGAMTIVFDSLVRIESGDSIAFVDENLNALSVFILQRDGDGNPINFTQVDSATASTVTLLTVNNPFEIPANVFADPDLNYDTTDHTLVNWQQIRDTRGNEWANHTFLVANDAVPLFSAADNLGLFSLASSCTGCTNTSAAFTLTITASHAVSNYFDDEEGQTIIFTGENLDLQTTAPVDGTDCTVNPTTLVVTCDEDFVANFLNAGATCTDFTGSTATLSADRRTLTFNVDCNAGALATNDVITLTGLGTTTATSDYEGTGTVAANIDTATDVTVP